MGQLVGPGIAAEIVEPGVAEAGVRIVVQQIDARKAALRELIPAGERHAVLSGAKLVEVDHLALSKRCRWGLPSYFGSLAVVGPFKPTVPRPKKL